MRNQKVNTKYKRCIRCKERKRDVRNRLDPYLDEIWERKKYIQICDDCEQELKWEI